MWLVRSRLESQEPSEARTAGPGEFLDFICRNLLQTVRRENSRVGTDFSCQTPGGSRVNPNGRASSTSCGGAGSGEDRATARKYSSNPPGVMTHSKRLGIDATFRKPCGMPRGRTAEAPAETVRRSSPTCNS